MNLNTTWLLLGLLTTLAIQSLALTSDYLSIALPALSLALSTAILAVGARSGGPVYLLTMVFPIGLGMFYLLDQPLPGMVTLPLIFGIWFGLANRLLDRPVCASGFTGQAAVIVSAGLLFWRHSGAFPVWVILGLACYGTLSTRPTGRRVLP